MSGSNFLSILANPTVMQPDAEGYAAGLKMAGQQWSNRQNQANQLSGQAQQAAIGADGTYSPELYRQGLQAAGPGAALAAQSGLAANQVQSDAQLAQARKLADFVNSASGAALKANDFSDQAMGALFNQAHAAGFSIPQVGQEMAGLPADAAGRKAWLQQHQMTSASTQLQLDQTYGTRQSVDTGGATVFPVVPPASAGGSGPVVPNTTSPAQKITPVTGPSTPTGAPTTISASEYARNRGLDPNTGNPLPNPAFAGLPSALRGPNQQAAQAPAPQATGVGPAATNAMSATGTSSSAGYDATDQSATKAVGQRALLQSMAGDASQFTTGPGATGIKDMKALIQRVGGVVGLSPVDAGKLAANEDLDKVAAQLADAQGAGSDARLAVNQGANPSSHNTPAGLSLILGKLTGNADYNIAKGQLAQQYRQTTDPTAANNRAFEAQARATLNPQVFQFNRLNQQQQAQYLSEIPANQRDAFKRQFIQTKEAKLFPNG